MKNHRVFIETIWADNQKGLTEMQQKINKWMTDGLLVKYDLHTTSTNLVFNICLKKEADKV